MKNQLYPYSAAYIKKEYGKSRNIPKSTVDRWFKELDDFLGLGHINDMAIDFETGAVTTKFDLPPKRKKHSPDNKKIFFALLDEKQKGGFFSLFKFFDFKNTEIKDYTQFLVKGVDNSSEYLLERYLEFRDHMDKLISELESEPPKKVVAFFRDSFCMFDIRYQDKYSQEFEHAITQFEGLLPVFPEEEQHAFRLEAADFMLKWIANKKVSKK